MKTKPQPQLTLPADKQWLSRWHTLLTVHTSDKGGVRLAKEVLNVLWSGGLLLGIVNSLEFFANNVLPPEVAKIVIDLISVAARDGGLS